MFYVSTVSALTQTVFYHHRLFSFKQFHEANRKKITIRASPTIKTAAPGGSKMTITNGLGIDKSPWRRTPLKDCSPRRPMRRQEDEHSNPALFFSSIYIMCNLFMQTTTNIFSAQNTKQFYALLIFHQSLSEQALLLY